VEFVDNMYAASLYPIKSQEILISLPSLKKIEYFTEKGATKNEKAKTIRYGPFTGVYKEEELRVHFELSQPLIHFPVVNRQIELSHLGSIGVKEHFELKNNAAELEGEFDRVKYNQMSGYKQQGHIFRRLHTQLPRKAYNLYYRDIIGNVTTSVATRERQFVFFEVQPLFPVLGGWQTKWYSIG
jgi:oligosaccharyltransferase complex subunit alpha (ribophorin I)